MFIKTLILCLLIDYCLTFINQLKCFRLNSACECSKPGGPDLGLVFCDQKLVSLNNEFFYNKNTTDELSIYKLTFKNNGLILINNFTFQKTGIFILEIIEQKLFYLPSKVFFGLERTLRKLSLQSNQLLNIPNLNGLTKLTDLYLNYNSIRQLNEFPIKNNLKILSLAHNQITFINALAFKNLKLLEYLDLSFNNLIFIDEFAFCSSINSFNIKIYFLNLASNRLIDIPYEVLSTLKNLQTLDLGKNSIEKIERNKTENIKICLDYLNLENNQIKYLNKNSFYNFRCLRILNLKSNLIEKIEDNSFKNLEIEKLNLKNCLISNLSSNVWNGKLEKHLTHLDLSKNKFNGKQKNDIFMNLERLTSFKFKNNLENFYFNPLSLAQSQYSLIDLELNSKNLNFNPINYEVEFINLRKLSLNGLTKLKKLNGYYNLKNLDISQSNIEELTDENVFQTTPWLTNLNISFNLINKLNIEVFKPISNSLLSLDLKSAFNSKYSKNFNCEVFSHLNLIRNLILVNNKIQKFKQFNCFSNLNELTHLQLDFNEINKINSSLFESLKKLKHLQISNNNLKIVEKSTFNELPQLIYIDLSFNLIKNIKSSAFNDLISLRIINLENNEIESIEQDSFINLPFLEFINFKNNQLKQFNWFYFDQIGTMSSSLKLNLKNNQLITTNFTLIKFSLSSFPQVLDLSNNQLIKVESNSFQNIRNSLVEIILNFNLIKSLDKLAFAYLPQLQFISIISNYLITIPDDLFIGDHNLQEINFSSNFLINLPSKLFINNLKLKSIDFSKNQIKKLPNKLFSNNLNLEQIYLDYNELREFPSNAFTLGNKLKIISLSHNYIEHLNSLENFKNLLELNLSYNLIKQFDFKNLNNLLKLDISFNKFISLNKFFVSYKMNNKRTFFDLIANSKDFFQKFSSNSFSDLNINYSSEKFKNFRKFVSDDEIHEFTKLGNFNKIKNFKKLSENKLFKYYNQDDLSNYENNREIFNNQNNKYEENNQNDHINQNNHLNKLRSKKIYSLDLSNLELYDLPTLNLPLLINLNLEKNHFSYIHSQSLIYIENLNILNLSKNRFTNVPNNIFIKLGKSLIDLDLSFNPIYTLNNDSFINLHNLRKLSIKGLHQLHYVQKGVFNNLQLLEKIELSFKNKNFFNVSNIKKQFIHFENEFDFNEKVFFNLVSNKKLRHLKLFLQQFDIINFLNNLFLYKSTNTSISHLSIYEIKTSTVNLQLFFYDFIFQLKSIEFEKGTILNCDCKLSWLKKFWIKKKQNTLNEISKWFSIDSLNENNHLHHLEKDSTKKLNKNQLDDLFIDRQNITYEQLLKKNLNKLSNLEMNLNEIKCQDENIIDNDLSTFKNNLHAEKKLQIELSHNMTLNNKFYLDKINVKMKNDRKFSFLDSFKFQMSNCLNSKANDQNLNQFTYLILLCLSLKFFSSKNYNF